MPNPSDDLRLNPEDRRREIAAILARGILRLGKSRPGTSDSSESGLSAEDSKSQQNGLELTATSRTPVTPG